MRNTLILAVAVLSVHSRSAGADPAFDRALELHKAGKHAEALAAIDAGRTQLPADARLNRWTISFENRVVPVALVGEKHLIITSDVRRRAEPAPPAGPVVGPTLDDHTDVYDFDTLITGFDAVTGKRLWTRRAPGHIDVAIDDRTDTVYAWRERLFRLKPTNGETETTVALPREPNRIEALVIAGRPVVPRPRYNLPNDDPSARFRSYDVDAGKTAERDLLMPVRLSPDERQVLALSTGNVPGGYGTSISARPFKEDKPTWTFTHSSASYSEPFWLGGDVVALIGDQVSKAEVVRLGGADGKVRWRFELPRGAYCPGRDQLRDNGYPARTWSAIGPCGDYLLAIGGEGSLYFLDPKTGKLAAKASPARTYLAFPRLVNGALVVCSFNGVRAIPWDVVLRRRAPDEGDYIVHRARCLHALGKTEEAMTELDDLIALDPGRAEAWGLKADLCRADSQAFEEIAARCRYLELTDQDASPELTKRWGLIKRIATGQDLRADLKATGDTVYAGTSAGRVYQIDARSLDADRTEYPGTLANMYLTEGLKALFYGSGWRDLGGRSEADPSSPVKGPPGWNISSGLDGPEVRWRGKFYRPLGGGSVRVLDGDTVREYKTKLAPIRQWQIHVSPWGPLGYGSGGVYELDDHLCPARKLIPAERQDVALLAGDAGTLAVVTVGRRLPVLQVWTRDGTKTLREQWVSPTGAFGRGTDHLVAVGGGYLLSAGDVTWVPAAADGLTWRFGFGDKPDRSLPKIHFAHASLFGKPLVRENRLFVGCRDGAVYVFDLNAVTRR